MVEPPPSTDQRSITITDLNMDALVHCASYLNLQDLSNMAMSCTYFNRVAYSDSIWQSLFRERWPQRVPSSFSQISGARKAYLARNTALQQFKFVDPLLADYYTHSKPYDQLFLDKNDIIFSQGPLIHMIRIGEFLNGKDPLVTLSDHRARITCMRDVVSDVSEAIVARFPPFRIKYLVVEV
ncbi:unnamed protein product [Ilex paraguariensis]|uniref:F-box domain-containing protein n=1 Tax=Ilex paraguariensis TaxID=185542 RepID=A0ABC8T0F5_9AQUA